MNSDRQESSRLPELLRLLDAMHNLYGQLSDTVRAKIQAMHEADLGAMQNALDREQALVARLTEREGLRKQLMDLIGAEIGLTNSGHENHPPKADSTPAAQLTGRTMTVSQLAERLSPRRAKELVSKAGALRSVVAEVGQANRVCGLVTQTLLHHLQWVFASVRPQSDPPVVYSGLGRTVSCSGTQLVDMVG